MHPFLHHYSSTSIRLPEATDRTSNDADAKLGSVLANSVKQATQGFSSISDTLLQGGTVRLADGKNTDIRNFFNSGLYLDSTLFPDKNTYQDIGMMLIASTAINYLWRQQKIFIIGGNDCGNNDQLGGSDSTWKWCDGQKEWHLYFWQEDNETPKNPKKIYGGVNWPWGGDKLSKGVYEKINIEVRPLKLFHSGPLLTSTEYHRVLCYCLQERWYTVQHDHFNGTNPRLHWSNIRLKHRFQLSGLVFASCM